MKDKMKEIEAEMMSDDISVEEDYPMPDELIGKANVPSSEIIYPSPENKYERPLGGIIGHEAQKKELLSVIDWFNHSKELMAKGVSVPKGIILYGKPGNGKSLFMKEIVKSCSCPVFVFQGTTSNVVKGIYETFQKAKKAGHSIIVFDELDLLIDREYRVVRALQENLDGVESNNDVLVLTATNFINYIPKPLLRPGRLEKLIEIPSPDEEERLALLKYYFRELHLEFPPDFDEEEVAASLLGLSCAGIKAVVNDLVLRNGFENITCEMIDESIGRINDKVITRAEKPRIETCIHEAGHAYVAHAFPEHFAVNHLNISGATGSFTAEEVTEGYWPYSKIIADIKISMAGVLAQKIICGTGSGGCELDLQKARKDAYKMFNLGGYSSCWETLPEVDGNVREETRIKRRRMERKIEALLRKCEKQTSRYIRKHKAQIYALGHLLYEKKRLKSTEILTCIG